MQRRADHDEDWRDIREQFMAGKDLCYLNHGSFGIPVQSVAAARDDWTRQLDTDPLDVLDRRGESVWRAAHARLASFVGASPERLGLVDNATYGMNLVADSFPLDTGDEVLLTDHEYGAVRRIWDRVCRARGAVLREAKLPLPLEDPAEVEQAVLSAVGPRTRLVVLSHITSPTAPTLPVERLTPQLQERGIAVCIDGPHAVALLPLALDSLGADFYTASCHKWLSGPLGTGFVYVAPRWHSAVRVPLLSWGALPPDQPRSWVDELMWTGTRSPAAALALPAAIDWLESVGLESFRRRCHWLAGRAASMLAELCPLPPWAAPFDRWYTAMAHCQLPRVQDPRRLRELLWRRHRIEAPIIEFHDRTWLRVSCHLYTTCTDLQRLNEALEDVLSGP